MLQRICSSLLALTLLLAPLTGVCVLTLATGRAAGVGVQPAHVTGAALLFLLCIARRWRLASPASWALAAAAVWTLASVTTLWGLDDVGLAGEAPWAKGLKQAGLFGFGLALAAAPTLVLRAAGDPAREVQRWERATSLSLAVVAAYGLYQAAAYWLALPGELPIARWVTSNPSVASGSGELYLGHRFVGVPRVSSTCCEPLYLAAYLLAAVPVAVAGAVRSRGAARGWRAVTAMAGAICFVLTFARGAYFGAAVLAALVAVGWRRNTLPRPHGARGVLVASGALVILAGAVGALAGTPPWQVPALLLRRAAQTLAGHDMSNLTRFYGWQVAATLSAHHPALGVGLGGYGFWYFPLAHAGQEAAHFGWPTPNSLPLQLLAETGVVGLVLWTVALAPAVRGLRLRPAPGKEQAVAASFLTAALVAAAWAQAFTYFQIHLLYFFLLQGVAAAIMATADPRPPAGRLV